MWIFEEASFIEEIESIPSIQKVEDDIDENEITILEDLLCRRSEKLLNLPSLISNLDIDTSFPDLQSGPVSFIH